MTDRITLLSPVPVIGWLVDRVFMRDHLQRFLQDRNSQLKAMAESGAWQRYLPARRS